MPEIELLKNTPGFGVRNFGTYETNAEVLITSLIGLIHNATAGTIAIIDSQDRKD